MKKTFIAMLAAAISLAAGAGGAVSVSRIDYSNLSSRIKNAYSIDRFSVDLGKTVSRTELRIALSNAAKDLDWNINFTESYEKTYKLGSVEEIIRHRWTNVSISSGPISGIDAVIYGSRNTYYFDINPGFISDNEIKDYLSAVSKHLPKRE